MTAQTAKTEATGTKRETTEDEVRDILADALNTDGFHAGRPTVMSARAVAATLLGFDPSKGQNTDPNFGGHTHDWYFNKHISMTKVKRLLDGLVDSGVAMKVNEPTFGTSKEGRRVLRVVHFPYGVRAGYVLAEHYDAASAVVDAAARNTRREQILDAARAEIAAKYDAEVQARYAELCTEAGLDAARESTDGQEN